MIYLDTHAAAWLYAGETRFFPKPALRLLNEEALLISPMAVLELEFLREIGRITVGAEEVLEELSAKLGLEICRQPFERVAREALQIKWTRDPFDRLIVAQAQLAKERLLTKDEAILKNYPKAMWGAE